MSALSMLHALLPSPLALQQQVRAHRSEVSGELVTPWRGTTIRELHAEYQNIFRYGNRNAASHLWSTFLLDRAPFMPSKTLLHLASGYCAISGSPVQPSPSTRYRMSLERVDGSGKVAGSMFYCCWPCVCDTNDFIRVDSKTVHTADGPRTLNVTVIGDPCLASGMLNKPFMQPFDKRMTTISAEARELRCGKQGLEGATYSDHGFVIIGLFFAPGKQAQDGSTFDSDCTLRANAGYNSGMGEIFRQVAAISPIEVGSNALVRPSALSPRQLANAARRRGVPTRGRERPEVVAALEAQVPTMLYRLKPAALRAAAASLGVVARPIATKTDKAALVAQLAAALGTPEPPPPPPSRAALAAMTVRELQEQADRRGLDRRLCIERADLQRLLTAEAGVAEEEDDDDDHRSPAAEEAVQRHADEEIDEEETREGARNWMEGGAQSHDLANATSRDESCAENGTDDDGASLQEKDVRWTTVSAHKSETSAEATDRSSP